MPLDRGGPTAPATLLILGGTTEAAALARAVVARFGPAVRVVTSLAGRTERPGPLPGEVRVGGFGGPDGLAAWLDREQVTALVDATHPFAATMSANAAAACERAGVPRLMLVRPMWRRDPADRWIDVPDTAAAVRTLDHIGRRVFLTTGSGEFNAFSGVSHVWFLVRAVDRPAAGVPLPDHHLILARGPFREAEERALMLHHRIDLVVTKASGGAATEGKILAARALGLPVVMIRRPPAPAGEHAGDVDAAMDWLRRQLAIAEPA